VGWAAVCWVALSAGACSKKDTPVEQPPAPAEQRQPAVTPEPAPPAPQEEKPVAKTVLDCGLSVAPSLKAGEPVEVTFQLTNHMAGPALVLNWRTPLEGSRGDDFAVTRDGKEIAYQGPMVKRADPTADNYVMLSPGGGTVQGKVDLAKVYDLSKPGTYRIAFRGELLDVAPDMSQVGRPMDKFQPMTVACEAVETVLRAR
jgi:peptidyl-Lys metalloendopeptidase